MTNVSPNAIAGTWARLAVAVFFGVGLVFSVAAAHAENSGSGGASPVEEFSQQLEAFQKSVPDLNKSIQDSAGTIDSMNDVEKARAEIDKLRETVSRCSRRLRQRRSRSSGRRRQSRPRQAPGAGAETRFKQEERQFLIDQWRRLQDQTESATKELDDARAQFAGLLQTLQQNEDFIGELIEIRQAEKALEVIRSLTRDIRDASNQLNKLIGGIKPPGA
jgi:peptidoglycan hydrolase CwlO-like protein